jgi:hypothetical protein
MITLVLVFISGFSIIWNVLVVSIKNVKVIICNFFITLILQKVKLAQMMAPKQCSCEMRHLCFCAAKISQKRGSQAMAPYSFTSQPPRPVRLALNFHLARKCKIMTLSMNG